MDARLLENNDTHNRLACRGCHRSHLFAHCKSPTEAPEPGHQDRCAKCLGEGQRCIHGRDQVIWLYTPCRALHLLQNTYAVHERHHLKQCTLCYSMSCKQANVHGQRELISKIEVQSIAYLHNSTTCRSDPDVTKQLQKHSPGKEHEHGLTWWQR